MPTKEQDLQKEILKIWEAARKRLRVLGGEALVLARKGEKEIARAARIGRLQFDVLGIKRRQDQVHQEIGRRVVELSQKGEVEIPGLKSYLARAAQLNREIRTHEGAIRRVRATARNRRPMAK
ncbi:MAG: hypothetical protein HYY14_00665 [Candidatus Omnitrophica bacterium]|nr:hypothetical protein [Candidatus Omnitrophota bacterium]